jgi:hypothetical protein
MGDVASQAFYVSRKHKRYQAIDFGNFGQARPKYLNRNHEQRGILDDSRSVAIATPGHRARHRDRRSFAIKDGLHDPAAIALDLDFKAMVSCPQLVALLFCTLARLPRADKGSLETIVRYRTVQKNR